MAWHMLAAIGHGRPSLLVQALVATLALMTATNGWLAVSSIPNFNGSICGLLNDPCFHQGQKGAHAVSLTSRQPILDINGDALLIPASTAKLITSAAALLRLSPHYRFRAAFLTTAPVRNGGLQGDLYLKGYGDPTLVLEEARIDGEVIACAILVDGYYVRWSVPGKVQDAVVEQLIRGSR